MTYIPTSWQDLPNTSTPITAAQLNRMEAGIVAAYVQGTGGLLNIDIGASAAIAYSKLNLALSIVNADVSTSAAIVYSKLNLAASILNADIASGAAIALSKLADPGTGKVVGSSGSAAAAVFPPATELAYQLYTSDQTTSSTSMVDLFTFSAATMENVKYYFEIVIPNLRASISGDSAQFRLMEGVTQIGETVDVETHQTAGVGVSVVYRMPFTPTAAAHTYKVQWLTVFAATLTLKASAADAVFRIVKA